MSSLSLDFNTDNKPVSWFYFAIIGQVLSKYGVQAKSFDIQARKDAFNYI